MIICKRSNDWNHIGSKKLHYNLTSVKYMQKNIRAAILNDWFY